MQIKIGRKDLVWSYLGYFLQICSNVILLPLILANITSTELGLWYTFTSVGILVNLLDMGFSPTLTRNITYAWSGAKDIQKEGAEISSDNSEPNYLLLNNILYACKKINMTISLMAILVLLFAGTPYIIYVIRSDMKIQYIIAWIIYCFAIFINLYFNYWTSALKGIGAIMQSQKAVVFSFLFYLLVCGIGILSGFGLIAMTIGFFTKGFVLRQFSKYYLLREERIRKNVQLKKRCGSNQVVNQIVSKVWYNAKKTGVVSVCAFVITQANTMICSAFIGLSATASYGLCLQIVNLVKDVSRIYYNSHEPQIASCRVTNDRKKMIDLYSCSVIVYWLTFIVCVIAGVFVGIPILRIIKSDTEIPIIMFLFMSFYLSLEGNHSVASSFIATGNEVPYLNSSILAAVAIGIGSLIGAILTHNIYCLMIVQCIVQLCYANWKWPMVVLKDLKINILDVFRYGMCELKTLCRVK